MTRIRIIFLCIFLLTVLIEAVLFGPFVIVLAGRGLSEGGILWIAVGCFLVPVVSLAGVVWPRQWPVFLGLFCACGGLVYRGIELSDRRTARENREHCRRLIEDPRCVLVGNGQATCAYDKDMRGHFDIDSLCAPFEELKPALEAKRKTQIEDK